MNKKLISIAVILVGIIGIMGMLFCFPFLWSSNTADLIGAGFPFVAGAMLLGSALVTLAINHLKLKVKN